MIKARVTDIDWDMPADGPRLATAWNVTIDSETVAALGGRANNEVMIEDAIVDEVSNRTGWCIRGCSIEILN